MKRHQSFSKSGMLNIALQILVLLGLYIFGANSRITAEGVWHIVWLVLIVLTPSIIWGVFFYLQDRNEPEPTQYVIVAFIAGMAVASLFGLPFEGKVFSLNMWMHNSLGSLAMASIFVKGSTFGFLIYIIIRYGFFLTHEFDEPADGMVYGAMAGAGYAFVVSLNYLFSHSDFTLFSIGYTATTNILMYTSVGSVIGYIIGYSKFYRSNQVLRGVVAIVLGMFLIGLYNILQELIFINGFENAFWISFILTLFLAIALLAFVYYEMRRLTEKPFHEDVDVSFNVDWIPIAFVIIVFIIGSIGYYQANSWKLFKNDKYTLSFKYPNELNKLITSTSELISPSLFNKTDILLNAGFNSDPDNNILVKAVKEKYNSDSTNPEDFTGNIKYTSIATNTILINGKRATQLSYSYLKKQDKLTGSEFDQIIWTTTDIIPSGNETYVFTYSGTPNYFTKNKNKFDEIIGSIKL